jgi:hypothetical protein
MRAETSEVSCNSHGGIVFDALFGSPVRPRFGAILSAVFGRRISGTACRDVVEAMRTTSVPALFGNVAEREGPGLSSGTVAALTSCSAFGRWIALSVHMHLYAPPG